MIKYIGISFSVLFCSLLIKDKNRTVAALLSVSGACILFFGAAGELKEIITSVSDMASGISMGTGYIKLMLKVLAITLMTQLTGDICRDNGESALATVTEITAKIIVIALVLPVFETVITIVGGLIK